MKNDLNRLQQPEEQDTLRDQEQEKQKTAKRASFAIFLLVLLLFAAVMCLTYFFEVKYGKTAGTIAMVIVALIIAGCLYRKEIAEKLKRRK